MSIEQLTAAVRDIPDFPTKGIIFKDISPIIEDAALFRDAVDLMAAHHEGAGIDRIVGIDARGFIFGAAIAYKMGLGMAMVRKKGKLPWQTVRRDYELEYGMACVEMHRDGVHEGDRVLVVDDLLATGGTAEAACRLVEELGGNIIGVQFLIELTFLPGREKLAQWPVNSLIQVTGTE